MKIVRSIKKLFVPMVFIIVASCANDSSNEKDKAATTASYYLPAPAGWTTELMAFPIEFAPGIHYTGKEDLRFAKGWGDIVSDEHWCYAFAWWLDGQPVITADTLQQHLTEYYTGLVQRNIVQKKIPANKIVPTTVTIKTTATMSGDIATYKGTISMLDYHSESPIVLNCLVHKKRCDTKDHTALLVQISPRTFDHSVWKQLNSLNTGFSCGN